MVISLSLRKRYFKQAGLDVLLVDIIPTERRLLSVPYLAHNGLKSILASIRDKGYSAEILFNLDPTLSQRQVQKRSIKEIISKKPQLLGFSPYQLFGKYDTPDIRKIEKIVKKIHSHGIFPYVVLGGHFASLAHKELMEDFPWIDFVARGEGEETFNELLFTIKNKGNLKNILGLTFWAGKKIHENAPRPNMTNLDHLPLPALDDLEFAKNNNISTKVGTLCSSRGCYGKCSYCSIQNFYGLSPSNNCWRAKSPQKVVNEMEILAKTANCREFEFFDDNFIGPGEIGEKRAVAIAEEILKRKLKINFSLYCRANDVDKDTMKILKQAGLKILGIGVESGSNEGLKTYSKGVTVEEIKKNLLLLNRMRIKTDLSFIFLNPYSTFNEIKENINFYYFIRPLKFILLSPIKGILNPLLVFSGTSIKKRLEKDKLLRGDYINGYNYKFKDARMRHVKKMCDIFTKRLKNIYSLIGSINQYQNDRKQPESRQKITERCTDIVLKSIKEAIIILEGAKPHKIGISINKLENKLINIEHSFADKLNRLQRNILIANYILSREKQ